MFLQFGAADTIIPVSDISAFLEAPNLATIGADDEGETVLYTAKTDAALSGCQRGVEGAARAWMAGELIGRNFTAKDHNDLIDLIEAVCSKRIDGVSLGASTEITHYSTCSTAAAAAEKVVSLTGFSLVAGAAVRVKFTTTNTSANPTLNVNNTGAKPIYYRGSSINAGYLAANRTYEFVYNGTQYELVGDINTDTTPTNITGNAGSATKLQTARTIQVNLESAGAAPFNGTANVKPGVTGILGTANGGTGNDTGYITAGKTGESTIGSRATAEGYNNVANATCAHAEGSGNTASGARAHAEGTFSTARGQSAHAEGELTHADSNSSHAEGSGTAASGYCAHAEGGGTVASGNYAHTEGYNNLCDCLYGGHAEGGGTISVATKCYIPIQSASGKIFSADTDMAEKIKVNLSGVFSRIAAGMKLYAWNDKYANSTIKIYTVVNVDTTNYTITVEEDIPSANYIVKRAIIPDAKGTAEYYTGHAEGYRTIAYGNNSHVEGTGCVASGAASHAEGGNNIATNRYSHAEGLNGIAAGQASHAEGMGCTASGLCSHAEGYNGAAKGSQSHAEGEGTTASGEYSHAEGSGTTAGGNCSHSGGRATIAAGQYQTAIGSFNVESNQDTDKMIIGKGASESDRANCFRVTHTGVYATGAHNTTGADYAELFEWTDGNPDKEDRCGRFVTLDGEKIRLAGPEDDFILGIISGNPSVVGDVHDDQWQGMFLYDIMGRPIWEDVEVPAVTEEVEIPVQAEELDESGQSVERKHGWKRAL